MKRKLKPRKKINKKNILIASGISLLTVILVAALLITRHQNEKNNKKNEPVDYGEAYENFNQGKAEEAVKLYFDSINDKDTDKLIDICYSEALLEAVMIQNNADREKLASVLKESLDSTSLVYKDMVLYSHKAYRDEYVSAVNDRIESSTGDKDSISAMYEVSIKYYWQSDIGWEEKTDAIKMYVTDGRYHVMIFNEDE